MIIKSTYCRDNNIPILMRIPFDREIAFLYSQGIPFVDEKKEYRKTFEDMFLRIQTIINEKKKSGIHAI